MLMQIGGVERSLASMRQRCVAYCTSCTRYISHADFKVIPDFTVTRHCSSLISRYQPVRSTAIDWLTTTSLSPLRAGLFTTALDPNGTKLIKDIIRWVNTTNLNDSMRESIITFCRSSEKTGSEASWRSRSLSYSDILCFGFSVWVFYVDTNHTSHTSSLGCDLDCAFWKLHIVHIPRDLVVWRICSFPSVLFCKCHKSKCCHVLRPDWKLTT